MCRSFSGANFGVAAAKCCRRRKSKCRRNTPALLPQTLVPFAYFSRSSKVNISREGPAATPLEFAGLQIGRDAPVGHEANPTTDPDSTPPHLDTTHSLTYALLPRPRGYLVRERLVRSDGRRFHASRQSSHLRLGLNDQCRR